MASSARSKHQSIKSRLSWFEYAIRTEKPTEERRMVAVCEFTTAPLLGRGPAGLSMRVEGASELANTVLGGAVSQDDARRFPRALAVFESHDAVHDRLLIPFRLLRESPVSGRKVVETFRWQ